MIFYNRYLKTKIIAALKPGKAVLLFGARRVGKTSLINKIAEHFTGQTLILNGEDITTSELLQPLSVRHYKRVIGNHSLLIIDEAQKIENIGQTAKLFVDGIPHLRVLLTGSSAFDMTNRFGEPLTGRKITFTLFPLTQQEFLWHHHYAEAFQYLPDEMIYGCYPEVWHYQMPEERVSYLKELASDYLLKDILQFEGIRNAGKLKDLLRLVAFQIGKEVSYDELGRQLGMSKNTVERYLDLLSKVFVLFKVTGFSRNLRKEVSKTSRWYFYDNGIRNIFVANFNTIPLRQDVGQLWENFCVAERMKYLHYRNVLFNYYFWRTYDQQEINWVEERQGELCGYEFKWKEKAQKPPIAWQKAYPNASYRIIHKSNFLDWVTQA